MLPKIGAAIISGVLAVLLLAIGLSYLSAGMFRADEATVLAVYRPTSEGNRLVPMHNWVAGTQIGDTVLAKFASLYNSGVIEEQNLVGIPDYVLLLGYDQQMWAVEVYGDWFKVLRPNGTQYTFLVRGWQEFKQEYLAYQPVGDVRIPSELHQLLERFMHERMAGSLNALNAYLLSESYYRFGQLIQASPKPEMIRGYEIKEVKRGDLGEYTTTIRIFGGEPASTWEEEYAVYPMATKYKLSLLGRWEYVAVHS